MPLTNSIEILKKAQQKGYAVPAFNVYNLESVSAVVEVCEKLKKDAILSVSESAMSYAGAKSIAAIVCQLTQNSKQFFALHLDHGKSFDSVKKAIGAGFTSVMIDASTLPFNENVALTKKVADYSHKHGVSVEGELGKIIGTEDIISSKSEHFTDPEEARLFAEKTGIDSLAISIGTAHGINKATKTPKIQFSVIESVHKLIPSIPLVAHGCSTVPTRLIKKINSLGGTLGCSQGIDEDSIRKMAKGAICKINIDSDLRLAFTAGIREAMANGKTYNPRDILSAAKDEMKKQVEHIFSLLG